MKTRPSRNRQILILLALGVAIYIGSAFSPSLQDDADIAKLWSARQRLFFFTYEDKMEDLRRIVPPGSIYPVASSGRKAILTNRP